MMSKKKIMRVASALLVVGLFAAPALAEHFDWADTSAEPTAEDAHVNCPELDEGGDAEAAQAECDAAVAGSFGELNEYDHPENQGKYVSFVAHCLKGADNKGQLLKSMKEDARDGDDWAAAAVTACSDFALNGETKEDAKDARAEARDAKKAGDSEGDEAEDDAEGSDEDGASVEADSSSKASKSKGNSKK